MASICPNCSQLTLGYDSGEKVKCPICGTVFEICCEAEGGKQVGK